MNLITNILSGLTGAAGVFLFLNIYIMLRNRRANYLGYAIIGVAAVIYIPCNLLLYHVTTPAIYAKIVSVQMYGTALYILGLILIYARTMKFSPRPLLTIYGCGFGFFLIARTIDPMLIYAEFPRMTDFITLWG